MQISSNICLLMTYMMVFVLKITSINHINESSTNHVFAGCESISFRNRFSSPFFLLCALAIGTPLVFPFQIFPPFYSTLSVCKIYEFLSYSSNQKITNDFQENNELMCMSTRAVVSARNRARLTIYARQ